MLNTQREQYTVSELNRKAKRLLETHLNQIWVEGEISNFTQPASGHWYFTLKDSGAQIRCAMFRNRNALIKALPKAGDQVVVRARVSLYEPRGDYQLIAEHMEPAGEGLLQKQYEDLKQKLFSEGLFNPEHKQPLPTYAQKIGIISSPTGAAVHDILHVLARRNPSIEIVLIPSSVQGEDAPNQLLNALALAEKIDNLDIIILGRGGGSLEDLWAFNNERLARAVFQCTTPIISAVGHEIDFSITDLVADVRAPTPSAAAELASNDTSEQLNRLNRIMQKLHPALIRFQQQQTHKTTQLAKRLKHPGEKINQWQQRTDICETRLIEKIEQICSKKSQRFINAQNSLKAYNPALTLHHQKKHINQQNIRLVTALKHTIESKRTNMTSWMNALDIISPLATLKRGYTIAKDSDGAILKSKHQCKTNTTIALEFHDGTVNAKITN